MNSPVLVLGIGNPLFSDDGAGLAAVRAACSRWQGAGVDFAEATEGGLELLDRLLPYRAVLVVDAAVTGQAAPGEVFLLDSGSLNAASIGGAHGAHLGTALALAVRMGLDVPQVTVLCIEAGDVERIGENLTQPVAAAIERAASAILTLAAQLALEVAPGA